jgi:hypothetical protein
MKQKKFFLPLFFFLIPLSVILTQCFTPAKSADPRGENYAGSETCRKCHSAVYEAYIGTPHSKSSSEASVHNIHGSFVSGQNVFSFNDSVKVVMENLDTGLFQAAYRSRKLLQKQRFDIVFGNRKAQTYLYWKNDQLFELPISYFDGLHSWTNSPGYAGGVINFGRPIVSRCFECHSSNISEKQETSQTLTRDVRFDKSSIILGIDCERCHGPGARHADYQTEHPEEKKAAFMTSFKSLPRARKLDACAVCHGGNKDHYLASSFGFKIGDTLANYKVPEFFHQEPKPSTIDMHGNQSALLAASRCFISSNMDCTTCHNTHDQKGTSLITYAAKCADCHGNARQKECKLKGQLGQNLIINCIDCHMPTKPSLAIKVESAAGRMVVPYLVRTHNIGVYPYEAKKVLAFISNGGPSKRLNSNDLK